MQILFEQLQRNPVIAAVHSEGSLKAALDSPCCVLFLLAGNVMELADQIDLIHQAGKIGIVHLDLVDGLSAKEGAVDILQHFTNVDGIISTRISQIKRAKQLHISAVQRGFMLDSRSIASFEAQVAASKPDFVELLPGLLPKVIQDMCKRLDAPIIAGGLIRTKSDMIMALQSGAVAVSVSMPEMWSL